MNLEGYQPKFSLDTSDPPQGERREDSILSFVEELVSLAVREHFHLDEDDWYSCPLAPDCCANDNQTEGVCDCGAEKHNNEVFKIADKLFRILKGE